MSASSSTNQTLSSEVKKIVTPFFWRVHIWIIFLLCLQDLDDESTAEFCHTSSDEEAAPLPWLEEDPPASPEGEGVDA